MNGIKGIVIMVVAAAASLTFGAEQTPHAGDEYNGVKLDQQRHVEAKMLPVKVTVDEREIIKQWSGRMLGYNHNWMGTNDIITDWQNPQSLAIAPEYLAVVKGGKLPLNRMSGTVSQKFSWKKAIGSYEQRQPMKLTDWARNTIYRAGVVEWVKSVTDVDSEAEFTFTLNMVSDSVQDNADLVEFLTGDSEKNPGGGVNWAKKRVELGLRRPVKIVVWELGNELDWGEEKKIFSSVEIYIKKCQEVIAAVRKVAPEAKFAPHAASAPWSPKTTGDWTHWHQKVLAELGDQIDYLVFHPYYLGLKIPLLEKKYLNIVSSDIRRITGSDRIKLFISEHALWPPQLKNKPWKDTWHQTHGLIGCLATAEWINRMYARPEVTMMTYHSFNAGPWGAIYRDQKTKRLYTTGIFDMFNLLISAGGKNVVSTAADGERAKVDCNDLTFTVSAITTATGLNLILVNREPETIRQASFRFQGRYALVEADTLTAPGLHSFDTLSDRPITVTRQHFDNNNIFNAYSAPPKALVILRLKKLKDDATK